MQDADSRELSIGLCGLGKMGLALANRLLSQELPLRVWNRTAEKTRALERDIAGAAGMGRPTPARLAQECDLVLLFLADSASVEEVAFGEQGLAEGAGRGLIVVDHSTVSPGHTRELAARWAETTGGQWIDAPVSGGIAGIERGTLAIMAGGDGQAIETVSPVLSRYSSRLTRMGDVGAGQATKLVNQTIVASTIGAIAEAVRLSRTLDIDTGRLLEALTGGWADSTLLQTFLPRMVSGRSEPVTGTMDTMLKDLNEVETALGQASLTLPLIAEVRNRLDLASRQGLGQEDISRIIEVQARQPEY